MTAFRGLLEGATFLGGGGSSRVFRLAPPRAGEVAKVGVNRDALPALVEEAKSLIRLGAVLGPRWLALRFYDPDSWTETAPLDGVPVLFTRSEVRAVQPFDLIAALALAKELTLIHASGLAHGDIKPYNALLLGGDSRWIDFGLACPRDARAIRGGTPRYFPPDLDGETAASRDVYAFGLTLAELAAPELTLRSDLAEAARTAQIPGPLSGIIGALTLPRAAHRPSMEWVTRSLAAPAGVDLEFCRAVVHASYVAPLADRLWEGDAAPASRPEFVSSMAQEFSSLRKQLGTSFASSNPSSTRPPNTPFDRRAWLKSLTGSSAEGPSATAASDEEMLLALARLSVSIPLSAVTWEDIDQALRTGGPPTALSELECAAALNAPARASAAIDMVERQPAPSLTLVLRAIEILKRRGELGRALALSQRISGRPCDIEVEMADVLRRAGSFEQAYQKAKDFAMERSPLGSFARFVLARALIDQGRDEEGAPWLNPADSVELLETLALYQFRGGDRSAAVGSLDKATSLALDPGALTRVKGMLGYVLSEADPLRALESYREAAALSARELYRFEEATYLTGVSAIAVRLGFLSESERASIRARALWMDLGYPARASRACLNIASLYADLGRLEEAMEFAREARALAHSDAQAYELASLLLCDLGCREETREWLDSQLERRPFVHVFAARALDRLTEIEIARLDQTSQLAEVWPFLAWVTARVTAPGRHVTRDEGYRGQLRSWSMRLDHLADSLPILDEKRLRERLASRARDLGLGDVVERSVVRLRTLNLRLASRAGPAFEAEFCRVLGSVDDASTLFRSIELLSHQGSSKAVLRELLDGLVERTGAERGMLLLRAPSEAELAVRMARNFAQEELRGADAKQSKSLARRILSTNEPVLSVDASSEFGAQHETVHSLSLRSVLGAPIVGRSGPIGVVILEDRSRAEAFDRAILPWVQAMCTLAATLIERALSEIRQRRAQLRSERQRRAASTELESRERELHRTQYELRAARANIRETSFGHIIGNSPALERSIGLAERAAKSTIPVLLLGPSGVGKDLFARAIHAASPVAEGPFVSENVAAIPESLIESALFGHTRGAFTGADRPRIGLFEAAHSGTLFLDELGEMSLAVQAKLLRVIEDGVVHPVGSSTGKAVKVRLIAATNRDLERRVQEGRFREDLWYRINVVTLKIPSLAERTQDIPALVRHFEQKHGGAHVVSAAELALWCKRSWPGNVRELENEVRRYQVFGQEELGASPSTEPSEESSLAAAVFALEKRLITASLQRHDGNQTRVAKELGLSRFGLQKMVSRLGITSPVRRRTRGDRS